MSNELKKLIRIRLIIIQNVLDYFSLTRREHGRMSSQSLYITVKLPTAPSFRQELKLKVYIFN